MARVYQEAHILDTLTASVKDLQTKTADLAKAKGYHEEKIKNLTTAKDELQRKYDALEIRTKANEHNSTARLLNTHLSLSPSPTTNKNNTPLTPLHDLATNRPIRIFPRHERDIRTMSAADVVQCLQALDVPSLGLSGGEKKARLRGEIGLAKEEAAAAKGESAKTPTPPPQQTQTQTQTQDNKARSNTDNAKKAAEVRRKVLEAKQRKLEEQKAGKEGAKK